MSDDISIPSPTYPMHHRRDDGMDPGTRRLAIIAGGIVIGVLALYLGYNFIGHHGGEVPVVQADDRPIRVKPLNPGGMQIAGADNNIFSGGNDTAGSKLAPAPEAPDPAALRTLAAASSAALAPVPPALISSGAGAPVLMPSGAGAPVLMPSGAGAPALIPSGAGAPVLTPSGAGARTAPSAATPASAAPKIAAPMAQPAGKPAIVPPQAAHPVAGGKSPAIQLAAVGSEAAARAEWLTLQKRMPDLLGGRQPSISKTERDGKVFWRVRTAGFGDIAQAKTMCEKVRAKGGACSVAAF